MDFDASIDLTTDVVPPHIPPHQAAERVRLAVEQLPGAFWISVEWCGQMPSLKQPIEWVRVYRRSRGGIMEGRPWDAIKVDIKAKVAAGWGSVAILLWRSFRPPGSGSASMRRNFPRGWNG
jgi:hypothetical protein